MTHARTKSNTKLVAMRLPVEWIAAVKQHCEDAGFPGSHPVVIKRALEVGLKSLGIKIAR